LIKYVINGCFGVGKEFLMLHTCRVDPYEEFPMVMSIKDAQQELRDLYPRVENLSSAQHVWDRFLTSVDKKALGGDRTHAISQWGSIGMWVKARQCTGEKALIELGHRLGFVNEVTRNWLLREYNEDVAESQDPVDRPVWDREQRQLCFNGTVVRTVAHPNAAKNIVSVLNAFEEAGWPPRIDDPLPGGRNSQRLHATIQSLNDGLTKIVFTADGTGKGYTWRSAS
jgi:hypothetical protein